MVTKKHIDMLSTASPEDLAKVQTLSGDEIAEALQQGREERREAEGSSRMIAQGPYDIVVDPERFSINAADLRPEPRNILSVWGSGPEAS